jgi:hypothetical protein
MMPSPVRWIAAGAVVAVVAGATAAATCRAPARADPDLVLVVMDTVRAASTSLCGYDRPTTPVLERLEHEGWATSCAAVTPGTWTVPSHASFFTGWEVPAFEGGRREPGPDETLAGQLSARGYQTVLVSANMVLKKPSWFRAGFDRHRIAGGFTELVGDTLSEAVAEELAGLDPARPLFLVVNIVDAHAPYPEVPPGVGWVDPQPAVQHRMWSAGDTPLRRYVTGRMPEAEAHRYRARLRDGYDWGVHQADRSLGRVLDLLASLGRLDHARVVVTSDHGEFVGEHGLVGHGETLYEPGVRVPLLFLDTAGPQPALPEPLSARHVPDLLLGRFDPDGEAPASVVSRRDPEGPGYDGVAVWGAAGSKLLWRDGALEQYDLSMDPGETSPASLGNHPLRPRLESMVQAYLDAAAAAPPLDDATLELLKAAGYVE